jgi:uncharacterized protein (TIGR02594 family)
MRIKLALVLLAIFGAPVLAAEPQMDLRFPAGHMLDSRPFAKPVRAAARKTGTKLASKPKAIVRAPVSQAEAVAPSSNLVATARQYLGTNPTGWSKLWCGRFMAMVAPRAARLIGNPNLAINWAKLPGASGRIGDIAVLKRRGGYHVGIVSGFDRSGNPIIISGNHNRRVAEATYPKHRVVAYVTG